MALMNVVEAARFLGVSTHTIKRRLKKGELKGEQRATPQGFVWLVEVADDLSATPTATAESANHSEKVIELLKNNLEDRDKQISFLKVELESRRREIQELHVLLQQSQTALPAAGDNRSWWHKLWHRNGR
jgi:hypothetical protein